MEIISFVLGMFAVIGVATVALVVVSMVKIHNLNKKSKNVEHELEESKSMIYTTISDEVRFLNERLSKMDEHAYRHLEEQKRDIISYIDSRIDKLQSKKEANN